MFSLIYLLVNCHLIKFTYGITPYHLPGGPSLFSFIFQKYFPPGNVTRDFRDIENKRKFTHLLARLTVFD